MFTQFISLFIQLFFLLTPFFALTMFLTYTENMERKEQLFLSIKTTIAILIICYVIVFLGKKIFEIFGITVDAFRIGAGAILFLSGVDLVRGKASSTNNEDKSDVAVVPLATPIIVGPATIGTLLVMGSGFTDIKSMVPLLFAILAAVGLLATMLLSSAWINKVLGRRGLVILSRLTGLILAALSAQMIFTGVAAFLK